jgi:hypothetical protein
VEGGRHNLTFTHCDVLRHVLADFLDRPQHSCRHLPQMWAQDPELQDEITRVKASFNEQVRAWASRHARACLLQAPTRRAALRRAGGALCKLGAVAP